MEKYGVDIRWTSRYDYDHGGRLNLHAHDFYQIIYFIDGKGSFHLDENVYPIAPGTLFFIGPGVSHGFVSPGKTKCRTLDLKFQLSGPALTELARSIHAYQTDASMEMKYRLEHIRAEGTHKERYYGELASLSLLQILYRLARKGAGSKLPAAGLQAPEGDGDEMPAEAAQRLERYIRDHYGEELTLSSAAEQLCYSKSYLSQLFKQSYGCTFSEYVRQIRIEKAKEWIAYSALSLKQISERAGFKTIHHFSRVFKELEGVNPGEWKAREVDGIRKDVHFD